MLQVENIRASYGAIIALRDISLKVEPGEMVGVVGVNGAGKSTLLKVISGLVQPSSGSVTFQGASLVGRPPEMIVRQGIALVPEGRHVFPSLTTRENLWLGTATRKDRQAAREDMDAMCERFPILKERLGQVAGTLSGGEQQQLVIARALMSKPQLIMLDEPSLGLAPIIIDSVFEMVNQLREEGVSILIVEQNVRRTLAIVDRAYLMNTGAIEFSGLPAELLQHADIEMSYLGHSAQRSKHGA